MKVLVIDDNQQLFRDISFCLVVRYQEAIVASVADGASGIKMIETEQPNLVIMGSSLPDTDTLDLLSKIREFSDVPLDYPR